jgi:DNA polymerase III delta prime subunit
VTAHNGRSGNGSGDLDLLRAEIRQTRAELGQTVQALAAKTDVKTRVRLSAARTRQRLREQAVQAVTEARRTDFRSAIPAIVLAAAATTAVVAWLMTRGRRR